MKTLAIYAALLVLLLAACSSPEADPPPTNTQPAIETESAETASAEIVPTDEPSDEMMEADSESDEEASDEMMADEVTEVPESAEISSAEESATDTPEPTDEPTSEPSPTPTRAIEITEQYEVGQELTDQDVTNLMYLMTERPASSAQQAIEVATASGDERFIPVLIEMLRFGQLGVVPWGYSQQVIAPLQELSGETHGGRWDRWVEWYGATEIVPPAGFSEWKGRLLTNIDPRFGEFFQPHHESTIRVEEIQWGGVIVDGIPALDQAAQIPAVEATYLTAEEPVFGIAINGEAHAYPLRIIDWHEMANDVVGGVPVSLAYCTLCGAAIAYDGRASDGETYDFGSSGFLFRSNKLMYDRQTRTLWNQLTGEPVQGELVGTGVSLDLLPVVLTTWEAWQEQHPNTLVLDIDTGFNRNYELGAAYGSYFSAEETMFPVWQRSELLETKDQVYAITVDGLPKAYPLDLIAEQQVINDVVNGRNLVVIGTRGIVDVTSNRGHEYSPGSEVRVFDRGDLDFSPTDNPDVVVSADGVEWTITEAELVASDGRTQPRYSGHLAYWYGWFAFFPNTDLYGQ